MEYRPFGQTDLQVSAIGFGCWEFGGGYGHFDEGDVIAAIHRALDVGVNCFDTAEAYGMGRSEALSAKALGKLRSDVIVVTKFGIGYNDSGREKGRDARRESAMAAIERSLKFLNTDYVDVYLVHWPDPDTQFEETMQALDDIVRQGKARFVGVSNFRPEELEACRSARRVDVAQYGYHLFDRRMDREIFPYCREHGIGVMTYGPLAHGLLTGAFTEDTTFEESDWRSKGGAFNTFGLGLFQSDNFKKNVRAVEELKTIAAGRGKKINHLALRWVTSSPAVSVALVGCRTPAEVDDNLAALEWTLSDEERAAIDEVFARHDVNTAPDVWLEE